MEIVNPTPFVAERAVILDKTAAENLLVVFKATFAISERGDLTVDEEQAPIRLVDEFLGEPASSSIAHEAELGPLKLATDVFLQGHARAPKAGTTSMPVRFRVGPVERAALVFGRRVWSKTLGFAGISDPEPLEAVPLIWEHAFGGTDLSAEDPKHHEREHRNPVGKGFRAKQTKEPWVDTELPSIEDPRGLLKKPGQSVEPVGFGPIGRGWQPRLGYAGTYDEAWTKERVPLLPEDFDERFHNAAPPALVAPGHLQGGEPVEVVGCTAAGRVGFALPRIAPAATIRFRSRVQPIELACDAVTVDTEAMQLRVVWKGWLRVHRELLQLRAIECRVEGELP